MGSAVLGAMKEVHGEQGIALYPACTSEWGGSYPARQTHIVSFPPLCARVCIRISTRGLAVHLRAQTMVEAGTASAAAIAATSITKGLARDLLTSSLPVPDAVLQSCTERLVQIGMRASPPPLNSLTPRQ